MLTGNIRYRVTGCFKKTCVLQVEEKRSSVDPYFFDISHWNDWRDATPEDMQQLGQLMLIPRR